MTDNPKPSSPKPISEMITRMFEIRARRAEISAEDSNLVAENDELEAALMGRFDDEGLDRSTMKGKGTASITETVLPLVQDWDAFLEHLIETKQLHLLQRRVASAAYREVLEAGGTVPGVEPYTKRSINLRSS